MKELQQSKIGGLERERGNLRENATKISEHYEDIKDNLESLNTRVQRVVDYLQANFLPQLKPNFIECCYLVSNFNRIKILPILMPSLYLNVTSKAYNKKLKECKMVN